MIGVRNESAQVLLALVDSRTTRDQIVNLVERVDLKAVFDVATAHRVVGVVHQRLIDAGVDLPEGLAARLDRERLRSAALQLAAYQSIGAVAAAVGNRFLVVKGPVLGAAWYGDPSLRRYGDIDLLVRRCEFGDVIAALGEAGFVELSTNWEGFLVHAVAEVPLANEDMTLDLHWDLVAIGTTRGELNWDMAPLFSRAESVNLAPNISVATLDPADTLLHLCINGGLDGARALIKLIDVDVVARNARVDWSQFIERARAAGAGALCAAVLQRCNLLVGTPLPDGVLSDLEPFAGWLPLNAVLDRRRRDDRRMTYGVASGALVSSGRATRRATLSRLVETLWSYSMTRLGRPGLTDTGGALHWQRRPADGDVTTARQRYLGWVADG